MNKQKTNKSMLKRVKLTSTGKILRRHQLGAGHLKRHKSKNALNRAKRSTTYFKGESKSFRKIVGA